ncbi:MAG: MFS transporter [Clostridiales bacterium]|nr:MFS transporter [Clostridiales bacterium]
MYSRAQLFRIEGNYAAVQGSYWVSMCILTGFTTVYLQHHGFSDARIGLTSALLSIATILFQLFISSYSDRHPAVPLKRVIALLYVAAMVLSAVMAWIPLAVGVMMLSYALAGGLNTAINGLLNAQIMQYVNAGIPVQYGWPRGIGSIMYALASLVLGILVERYSPSMLMPLFLILTALATIVVLLMPDIGRYVSRSPRPFVQDHSHRQEGYGALLRRSPEFSIFLLSSILLSVGLAGSGLFLVRVVQRTGGGGSVLGISMFLQAGLEMPAMFLATRIMKCYHARDILTFSMCIYTVKAILLAMANTVAMLYLAMLLSFFCFGLYGFSSVYFVDGLVLPGERVRAQSLNTICGSIGAILSSLLSGLVMDAWGLEAMLWLSALIVALSCALMFLCRHMHLKGSFDRTPAA